MSWHAKILYQQIQTQHGRFEAGLRLCRNCTSKHHQRPAFPDQWAAPWHCSPGERCSICDSCRQPTCGLDAAELIPIFIHCEQTSACCSCNKWLCKRFDCWDSASCPGTLPRRRPDWVWSVSLLQGCQSFRQGLCLAWLPLQQVAICGPVQMLLC